MKHPCLCDICLKARDKEIQRYKDWIDDIEKENEELKEMSKK